MHTDRFMLTRGIIEIWVIFWGIPEVRDSGLGRDSELKFSNFSNQRNFQNFKI